MNSTELGLDCIIFLKTKDDSITLSMLESVRLLKVRFHYILVAAVRTATVTTATKNAPTKKRNSKTNRSAVKHNVTTVIVYGAATKNAPTKKRNSKTNQTTVKHNVLRLSASNVKAGFNCNEEKLPTPLVAPTRMLNQCQKAQRIRCEGLTGAATLSRHSTCPNFQCWKRRRYHCT